MIQPGALARFRVTPRRASLGAAACLVAGAVVFAFPPAAPAHEKWFFEGQPPPTRWADAFQSPSIYGVAAAIVLTAAAWLAWRRRGGRDLIPGPESLGATDKGRARFYALVPFILGVHLGLPLLILGVRGQLFSPNNQLPGGSVYILGVVQIGIGLSFLYGGLTRLAALALAATWVAGVGLVGLEPMLENVHVLGFAAFFFLAGRGPYAIDRLLFPALEPSPALARRAMTALRAGTGLSFAVVAFTEKLANMNLAREFLKQYPLNFTGVLGVPLADDTFIVCAGATELLIGLCLLWGLFPRLVIATAWVFINMTLTIFSWVELTGHLPLYGVMAVLLVWTPREDDLRLWVRGVRGEK